MPNHLYSWMYRIRTSSHSPSLPLNLLNHGSPFQVILYIADVEPGYNAFLPLVSISLNYLRITKKVQIFQLINDLFYYLLSSFSEWSYAYLVKLNVVQTNSLSSYPGVEDLVSVLYLYYGYRFIWRYLDLFRRCPDCWFPRLQHCQCRHQVISIHGSNHFRIAHRSWFRERSMNIINCSYLIYLLAILHQMSFSIPLTPSLGSNSRKHIGPGLRIGSSEPIRGLLGYCQIKQPLLPSVILNMTSLAVVQASLNCDVILESLYSIHLANWDPAQYFI